MKWNFKSLITKVWYNKWKIFWFFYILGTYIYCPFFTNWVNFLLVYIFFELYSFNQKLLQLLVGTNIYKILLLVLYTVYFKLFVFFENFYYENIYISICHIFKIHISVIYSHSSFLMWYASIYYILVYFWMGFYFFPCPRVLKQVSWLLSSIHYISLTNTYIIITLLIILFFILFIFDTSRNYIFLKKKYIKTKYSSLGLSILVYEKLILILYSIKSSLIDSRSDLKYIIKKQKKINKKRLKIIRTKMAIKKKNILSII